MSKHDLLGLLVACAEQLEQCRKLVSEDDDAFFSTLSDAWAAINAGKDSADEINSKRADLTPIQAPQLSSPLPP